MMAPSTVYAQNGRLDFGKSKQSVRKGGANQGKSAGAVNLTLAHRVNPGQ